MERYEDVKVNIKLIKKYKIELIKKFNIVFPKTVKAYLQFLEYYYYNIIEVISVKLINRDEYLNKIINVIGTPDIKVITGIRRSRKIKIIRGI